MIGAVSILKLTGINRMSKQKQVVALIVAAISCDIFVKTRKSSDIFYLIPSLEDEKQED
jgi:hypothetical protein